MVTYGISLVTVFVGVLYYRMFYNNIISYSYNDDYNNNNINIICIINAGCCPFVVVFCINNNHIHVVKLRGGVTIAYDYNYCYHNIIVSSLSCHYLVIITRNNVLYIIIIIIIVVIMLRVYFLLGLTFRRRHRRR